MILCGMKIIKSYSYDIESESEDIIFGKKKIKLI